MGETDVSESTTCAEVIEPIVSKKKKRKKTKTLDDNETVPSVSTKRSKIGKCAPVEDVPEVDGRIGSGRRVKKRNVENSVMDDTKPLEQTDVHGILVKVKKNKTKKSVSAVL